MYKLRNVITSKSMCKHSGYNISVGALISRQMNYFWCHHSNTSWSDYISQSTASSYAHPSNYILTELPGETTLSTENLCLNIKNLCFLPFTFAEFSQNSPLFSVIKFFQAGPQMIVIIICIKQMQSSR